KPPEEKPEEPKPIKKAIPADIQKALADWGNFIKDFEPNFAPFIAKTKAGYLEDEFLYIICPDLFTESHLRNRTEFIQDKLRGRYGVDFSINVLAKNFYDDRHRRKYNIEDDFAYASDMDKLRGMIDYDIEEV
ncbi:MAG: hypothetical protein FWC93_02625, partial [Defluviitaleaceae bacterium]|nr:hypothetical protein [Defluviitaleaceae bacterium]